MHNIVKLSAICLLCLLCSCNSGKGIKTNIENISNENDKYSINTESFSVDEQSEALAELNITFSNELTEWTEDFIKRAENISVRGSSPPCMQVRHTIKKNDGHLLSVVTEKYVYLSGLHGNTWYSAKNFDIKQDKIIYLKDLFVDDTYPEILTERIGEIIEDDTETYHDLWEEPTIDRVREDKFYLDESNLVIFYEPYELSYYARGVVEFSIPTEKIRGYIRPEYLSSK